VEVMGLGQQTSEESVLQARHTGESLLSISQAVSRIRDMSTQIAAAAEQQNLVTEEIARNMHNIKQVAEESAEVSRETSQAAHGLMQETGKLRAMVRQFGSR